ncbi:GNAT family N-acetyltransferase [Planctomycetota bacterium]
MSDLQLQYLDWDSKQLGIDCGLINCTEGDPAVLSEQVSELIEKQPELKFVTIKLASEYIDAVNTLVKKGALLIDTEVVFCVPKGSGDNLNFVSDDLRLEFCQQVDSKAFIRLAEQMRLSRFFRDAKIPEDKAIKLWEESIKNHCEGFADQLLVGYLGETPCSIVTVKFKEAERLFLHIVGVLDGYQGKGIGKSMLCGILKRYSGKYDIYVETQSINTAAQNLYKRAGFKFDDLRYILHYWRS